MHVSPSPGNMELFHLRLLLLNRPGMTSFKHLCRVNEGEQPADSFEEACRRLGLTGNIGKACDTVMDAVVQYGLPWQLRRFFSLLPVNCNVRKANALWVRHSIRSSRAASKSRSLSQRRALLWSTSLYSRSFKKELVFCQEGALRGVAGPGGTYRGVAPACASPNTLRNI